MIVRAGQGPAPTALQAEYDEMYRRKPGKWTNPKRDAWLFETLNGWKERAGLEPAPTSVLEIGCGNGHTIGYFMQRWRGVPFYGLDLSHEAVRIARRNYKLATFYQGALGEVVFRQTFDLVMMLGVLEHMPDIPKALGEVRKLIAGGSWLVGKTEDRGRPDGENVRTPFGRETGGIVFVECPNPLAYPESTKEEGFRRTAIGSRQMEWHLRRETWEELISEQFEIMESIKGPRASMEFVWMLR